MAKLKKALKKGVSVEVIAGKERKKTGKVISVLWPKRRVIVEKLNMQKRHTKPGGQNKQGGIVEKEGSIAISNVRVIEEVKEKPKKTTTARKATKKAS